MSEFRPLREVIDTVASRTPSPDFGELKRRATRRGRRRVVMVAAAGALAFIAVGGGYLGVHSAADTGYGWPWYGRLVGAWFKNHPPDLQTGTVRFSRPLREGWPAAWRVTDEFYNFRSRPDGEAAVIARLDESTYEGGEMGGDHPISWCRTIDGGRSWYTGLGHRPELFLDPVFLAHLEKGVLFAMSRSEEC